MSKKRVNCSKAEIIMDSMRSMGYTFEAALADVIDNSITAYAKNITVYFPVSADDCFVCICDDGHGMDSNELFDAMCYGSDVQKHIGEDRDLGRFGLGLKAASLSQCKKMTVVSKKNSKYSAFCWDIDLVKVEKNWTILELNQNEIKELPRIEYLDDKESGTVVIWKDFDVIEKSSGDVFSSLDIEKDKCSQYLSLIFHRFLNDKEIEIFINNYKLSGLDPFLENHPKTSMRKKIPLPIEDSKGIERFVEITPYVLPFQKDLTKKDKALVGGYENLRTKQGFYVYRNKRLIIYGTWFGMPKNELTKHARIKVDIPNTLDDIWSIDIKKQNAVIPKKISNQIRRSVEEAMDIAVKRQKYRGRLENIDDKYVYIWDRKKFNDKYIYKINRESVIADFMEGIELDDAVLERMDMIFKNIENSIPYQQIYLDMSGNEIVSEEELKRKQEVLEDAEFIVETKLKKNRNCLDEILEKLFIMEPYCKYPELKEELRGNLS